MPSQSEHAQAAVLHQMMMPRWGSVAGSGIMG